MSDRYRRGCRHNRMDIPRAYAHCGGRGIVSYQADGHQRMPVATGIAHQQWARATKSLRRHSACDKISKHGGTAQGPIHYPIH
jgi:hypothetical protein